jgi:hypothetical protein
MRGGESVKEDMMAKSLTGRAFFGGGRKHFEWRIYFCGRFSGEIGGVRSLVLGVFGESEAGGLLCWGFWALGSGYPYGILELGSRTGCS